MDTAGKVTHRGTGQTEIRATLEGLFGGAIILVNLSVSSISVTCVPDGAAYACTAIASFSNGTTQDVSRSGAAWSSSNTNIATVDSTGRVTAVANGQVEIAARFQSVVGGVTLTLSGVVTVASVTVTCVAQAETTQCAAVANRSDGSMQQVTSLASWSSSNTAVATVDQAGLVRHRTTGQTEIRATYQNITGSRTLDIVVGFGSSVVINEFRLLGLPDNGDQFDQYLELRNDSAAPVDVGGWKIVTQASGGSLKELKVLSAGITLGPGCHYLLATDSSSVKVAVDDRWHVNQTGILPFREGGVALQRPDGSIVDRVGWGSVPSFFEGIPLPKVPEGEDGNYTRIGNDTNNNLADFVDAKAISPQNSASSCSVR